MSSALPRRWSALPTRFVRCRTGAAFMCSMPQRQRGGLRLSPAHADRRRASRTGRTAITMFAIVLVGAWGRSSRHTALRRVRKIALRGVTISHGVGAILRTRLAPRIDYSPKRPSISARSPPGKSALDLPPARGKIGIGGRQCPNNMEMVRQDADGVGFEWQARLDRTINLPQAFDMFDKKLAGAVSKHHRKKEYPAFDFRAPIS